MTGPRTWPPSPVAGPPDALPRRCDVAVVGSGAAGLIAALRATDAGRHVVVLEKADRLGGTTAVSGGVMWAPVNHLMPIAGYRDSPRQATDYLRCGTSMTDEEIGWYLDTSAAAVRYLDSSTRVRYRPLARPDYHLEWPGAVYGRGLDSEPFNPSVYPGLGSALRPPTYFPLITMSERDALGGGPIDPNLLNRRRAAGIRTMGGALVGALVASALDRGIAIAVRARVRSLDAAPGGGWLIGVTGGPHIGLAADAVVLASGGFEWNPRLRSGLLPFAITPISAPSNEGDGLELGLGVGASLRDTTAIWGVPVIAPPGQRYDGRPSGRMGNVEMTLPGSISVNSAGRRFVNEALNYHDLTRVFGNVDPTTGQPANTPAWLVFDETYQRRYSVAGATPGRPEPWMIRAETPEELAASVGIDPAGLAKTIAVFNADARAGTDTVFGRGGAEQDRYLGDPDNRPNPCLAPLTSAPFYAVPIHAGALGTAGGLRVNLDGEVLDRDDRPISGLFAAGNCSATVFHDAYPGGGATLGSAMTRGFAVGKRLATRHEKSAATR